MRSITEKLSARLKLQAKEADVLGLKKISKHLDKVAKVKTRPTGSLYVYAEEDLKKDLEQLLWNATIRIADYYDCNIEAQTVQEEIERFSEELTEMIEKQAGINHGVGVYEPTTPGEDVVEEVLLEVK